MRAAYAFGCAAGLMVISQLVPFAKSVGIPGTTLAAFGLVAGAAGNAMGRILSGWMSDHLGRINVLRLMIGISMVAMPILYKVGGNVAALFVMLFVVYWCYGTQLSVNAATAADFWAPRTWASITACYSLPGVWRACSVAASAACYSTSIITTRWRSTRRRFWRRLHYFCELAAKRPQIPSHA